MASIAYTEGQRSFSRENGEYHKPYEAGTAECNDFERGWTDALKRAPHASFRGGRYAPNGVIHETSQERAEISRRTEIQRQKEAYAKAKGK